MFELGQVVATPGVMREVGVFEIGIMLSRHVNGDWGEIHPDDAGLNESAMEDGERILSVYPLTPTLTVWVITEADRSSTTLLLPEEY